MDCYQRKKQDVAKEFSSDLQNGLSEQQVNQNREKYGTNEFTKKKGDSFLKRFWDALSEPMVIILIVAAFITLGVNIVKAATGQETEFVECVGIFLAILLSVSITLVMEGRSKKAFEALNKIKENILVKVVRGGKVTQIPQHDIVVGDIVIFETGDKIPVDCRVIETTGISVDESSLTGESLPVNKQDVVLEGEVPLAERVNMLYSGCYVGIGECRAIVTAVGDETEFGKIAAELGSAETTSTPIQEKLAHLGKTITIIGGSAAAVIFLIQLVRLFLAGTVDFSSVADIFITSIVLIVASVPEGLPTIVAISLALNIIKMAKQNALVKKMVACETIGCINVICSDKTGTLTENRMTVMEVCQKGEMVKPEAISDKNLLLNFAINSTAQIEDGEFIGNPTECALLCAYGKTGQEKDYKTLRAEANVLHCYAFTSDTKNMTTVIKTETGNMAYSKGSPEKILSLCRGVDAAAETARFAKYQQQCMRILAFCHRPVGEISDFEASRGEIESQMEYDGFVAIKDPVRADVYEAVNNCKSAGISIKMLTGDNLVTAKAIAGELGILEGDQIALTAADIEKMSDAQLEEIIDKIRVIARSTPTTKMRVVNLLKKRGNVVAVTGDGVNDAPAIKSADVGIAMGITGTEVSKEAADIVLLDDSFSTIARAVAWGRGIYENFQRFIQFQLTVNVASVLTVLVSILLGFASPFTALQLLWINIIMDGPPALMLGLEPIRSDLMKRQPTPRDASIVTKEMLLRILANGLYVSAIFLWQTMGNFMQVPQSEQGTVLFTLFVLFQLFNAFNCRELAGDSIFKNFKNNGKMLLVIGATFVLQVVITQFGGTAFNTVPLSALTWAKMLGVAFTVILISEIYKLVHNLIKKKN